MLTYRKVRAQIVFTWNIIIKGGNKNEVKTKRRAVDRRERPENIWSVEKKISMQNAFWLAV